MKASLLDITADDLKVWTIMEEQDAHDKGHLLATDNYCTDVRLSTSLLNERPIRSVLLGK